MLGDVSTSSKRRHFSQTFDFSRFFVEKRQSLLCVIPLFGCPTPTGISPWCPDPGDFTVKCPWGDETPQIWATHNVSFNFLVALPPTGMGGDITGLWCPTHGISKIIFAQPGCFHNFFVPYPRDVHLNFFPSQGISQPISCPTHGMPVGGMGNQKVEWHIRDIVVFRRKNGNKSKVWEKWRRFDEVETSPNIAKWHLFTQNLP